MLNISKDVRDDHSSKTEYKIIKNIPNTLEEIFNIHELDYDKNESVILEKHIKAFLSNLKNEKFPSRKKPYPINYSLDSTAGVILYKICRMLKPKKVVETGVAYGNSSAYILLALQKNEKGTLYSIDSIFRPWESKEMIGSVIPNNLRENWKLIVGKSKEILKKTLLELEEIDIFFHDSLHTYKNMMFEFETAWPMIKKDGFLISDDVIGNNAFNDFCNSENIIPTILGNDNWSLGLVKKIS